LTFTAGPEGKKCHLQPVGYCISLKHYGHFQHELITESTKMAIPGGNNEEWAPLIRSAIKIVWRQSEIRPKLLARETSGNLTCPLRSANTLHGIRRSGGVLFFHSMQGTWKG
jgi:hypothetical protein